ncbi:MAG TPA: hypothetical protein VFZ61_06390, partial [Polyangiales bacterium]
AAEYMAAAAGNPSLNVDLRALSEQAAFGEPSDLAKAKPTGQLRHMIGIQYYFDEDISWLDGHAYFAGSPWGLSSISQVRFWQERHDWEHGYRGVLSVVISIFDQPGMDTPASKTAPAKKGKPAWECSPAEMAEQAWLQIQTSLGSTLPEPRYWHIDDDIEYQSEVPGYRNDSPYQINLPGHWDRRPGELDKPAGERYCAIDGIVCAGTHMKTFTRLTTMEAANESGRHAVNAILHSAGASSRKSPCGIWPIEEREVQDFKLLQELDDELYERGLDHFVAILQLDKLVTHGLRGNRADPLRPGQVLRQLRTLFDSRL